MKIEISPSEYSEDPELRYPSIFIDTGNDDEHISVTLEHLVRMLTLWGFQQKSISKYLNEEFVEELGLDNEQSNGEYKLKA